MRLVLWICPGFPVSSAVLHWNSWAVFRQEMPNTWQFGVACAYLWMSNIQLPALSLLWEWKATRSSRCGLSVGLRVEQGALASAWLAHVRVERKLSEEEDEVGCPAWHLMVCWELCTRWHGAVIWYFCLFRVPCWISIWRPSLWARQSLRSTCWWDSV